MKALFRNEWKKGLMARTGFTLVELMIVVAIIGILASIAIPNFQKFQSKARSAEAKVQLASAYSAEKSFFIEYSSYTGCLGAAGYAPELGTTAATATRRYYAIGFSSSVALASSGCGPTGLLACNGTSWNNGAPTCTGGDGTNYGGSPIAVDNGSFWTANSSAASSVSAAGQSNLPSGSTGVAVATGTFTIGAAGFIKTSASPANFDQWTINEGKVVNQTFIGY